MQRLLFVVIPAVIVIGLHLLVLSDTDISAGDTDIPNKEVTSSLSRVSNASASGGIMITVIGILEE